ncbi:flagellar biosynthesis/type III secretory pathway chaperone [Paenibacillus sp. SORGH_AS306]|uniref:Flagellar protein FlgN n=1 Tax=Paenibacillus kyungheensis TaxID=1452732 RepID=A0AAX3M1Y2_9BACL|nr:MULTISPECIES: flagellar protein FlgN [Paenibacillus]MDQ1235889.1 flagellar biosynthesis/type III secretory pathway chaperone [Paenibacillus sp. SORGH_AS_0306]MDR6112939.1 flagellar biosynthesis/type III secretory pathway chaperone [Paenibacillus sp. SORGH_AS_0338]WCT55378.1 flagellar protein FlgN [Paenibacillus kyungheensis]
MSSETLQKLVAKLDQMNDCHIQMIELGERKKQAVIKNEVESMIAIMNQESKLAKFIDREEQEREEIVHAFLLERGIKSKLRLNLTELARLVFDPEEKQLLLEARSRLSATLQTLQQLNELNKQLIQQALDYVDFSLEMLALVPEQDLTYQHPADKAYGATRSGLFDTRG